ncbi:hypothetical protein LCGC14_3009150 [marine sediment metagenome]|uniref:NAD-dependent epimerase/dehydratase domain-containing protein n=1 Tax=marine sediment metagenome TaxID=412755 RepID=A0A0F8WYN5_9ZZZZ
MIKNKRIFITGGAGFLGSHLTGYLCKNNKIFIFDKDKNLIQNTNLLKEKNVTFIKGSVLNQRQVVKEMKKTKPDIVLHMASMAHVENIYKSPWLNMEICLNGTRFVAGASVANKVKKFINFSTSEVYGPYAYGVSEDVTTKQGTNKDLRWTYSTGKVAGEHITQYYHQEHGLDTTIIRPFNITGTGLVSGVVFQMVRKALNGQPMVVYDEGNQIRAYCHVEDFINALDKIISNKKTKGQTYNIGNPRAVISMAELAHKINSLIPKKVPLEFIELKKEDVEVRVPSIQKIKKELKWEPKINLNAILIEYFCFCVNAGSL